MSVSHSVSAGTSCFRLISNVHRTALWPTQPSNQWLAGALSLRKKGRGVKQTTHHHLVLRSKNDWSYTFTPSIRPHGMVLN